MLDRRFVLAASAAWGLGGWSAVRSAWAQAATDVALDSPRLRQLQADCVSAGVDHDEVLAAFWQQMGQRGAPLQEPWAGPVPPGGEPLVLVTFLWRGALQENVWIFGAPSGDHDPMTRLPGTDVWFKSYVLPNSTRLGYRLAPDVPVLGPMASRAQRLALYAASVPDPLNLKRHGRTGLQGKQVEDSVLELAAAPPQPWITPHAQVPKGMLSTHAVRSALLGNTRDVSLYRPHGWRPGAAGNGLLVLFDREAYLRDTPTPVVLDNLIAAGRIPKTAAVLISSVDADTRSAELPPNPNFVRFLDETVMPWAAQQGVWADAGCTVVAGSSYGGLAAAHAAWWRPERFGLVYSQSGSFWWGPKGEQAEWLTRLIASQTVGPQKKPIRWCLEAGLFEGAGPGSLGILMPNRHLRDVLRGQGYEVTYREFASGHEHLHWRGSLAGGLMSLLGPQST